jgi:hypothetical protein
MHMLVVFGLEDFFCLPRRDVYCKPAFVTRVDDLRFFNSRYNEPIADCLNGFVGWGKKVMDFLGCAVLTKIARSRMGTVES